jgi:pimeloyl-ACP methyl ester carboxylesterase
VELNTWRQVGDVLARTIPTAVLKRVREIGSTTPSVKVGWRVVNMDIDGRNFRYRVTDNDNAYGPDGPGTPPIWVINLHGYFAGGSMYARESELLAERFGWRVVNPSLPAFGGSDPLELVDISLEALTDHVEIVRRELGITKCVVMGHSMGGAIAIDFASRYPNDVIAVLYRDGIATPEWSVRRGLTARVLSPILPDVAPIADLMAAVVMDVPDLLVGHMLTTLKALMPDLRSNVKTVARSAPVASMLLDLNLTERARQVAEAGVPIYAAWGCFDRVVPNDAAEGFTRATGAVVQWVPGGHSWMLARPSGMVDLLTHVPSGQQFVERIVSRWRVLEETPRLRRVV